MMQNRNLKQQKMKKPISQIMQSAYSLYAKQNVIDKTNCHEDAAEVVKPIKRYRIYIH